MAIIDLDEFMEKKEKEGFILLGKTYVIPEMTYALSIKLAEVRKEVVAAIKKDNDEEFVKASMKTLILAVPDLSGFERILRGEETDANGRTVKIAQLRKLMALINKVLIGGRDLDAEELEYYRNTYGDEYRKKGSEPGKKKEKKVERKGIE